MVKMLKKIEARTAPLNEKDQNKINSLLKTYEKGTIKFYFSYSGLHDANVEIKTLEEMTVILTSDSLENMEKLGEEFDSKIRESLGDKVNISDSNVID